MQLTRRLSSLLGADWEEVKISGLQRLVEQQVPEDFDLDYKASLYGGSDADKASLASDVAAFANHQGGLLLLARRGAGR